MSTHLEIIQGDIRDAAAVRRTLVSPDPGSGADSISSAAADIIIFGVGGAPRLTPFSIHLVTVDDPHVCGEGMRVVLDVLEDIRVASLRRAPAAVFTRPLVAAISTTGLPLTGEGKRDVPLPLLPLYRWLLAIPHQDKLAMEKSLLGAAATGKGGIGREEEEEGKRPVDTVVVRPTLLVDGERSGKGKVRVGWEHAGVSTGDDNDDDGATDGRAGKSAVRAKVAPGPAVGYSVRRADVGEWLFEEVVMGREHGRDWAGRVVTLSN